MKFFSSRQRVSCLLGIIVTASLASGLVPSRATAAEAEPTATKTPAAANGSVDATTEEARSRQAWRASMARIPMPKKGCFKATYPNTEWQEVPCTTAPAHPYPPARGGRPDAVGNGNDFSAQVSGHISAAVGSFDSVTGVTSEDDSGNNNTFSLQLNTNRFTTPLCKSAKDASTCQGWQQFVYSNSGSAFIQYWLIGYATKCPSGWNTLGDDCWKNANNAASVPVQAVANLSQLSLTGQANANSDTIIMATGSGDVQAADQDSVLGLAQGWQAVEYNVFGDCCASEASFNLGSTIVVRTSVNNGTANAPSCVTEGFTGETNNLRLVSSCSATGGSSPAVVFTESFIGPPAATAPFVDVYSGHDQQHFAYLATNANGRDGEIWDMFYCQGCSDQVWQLQKINSGGVTSGPPAATTPSVNVYSGHDQQHFAYLATNENGRNGEIWDAFYCPGCSGNKWRIQKINDGGVTKGPPAVSGPVVDTYAEHDQQHFVYLAANGEIWDAFYCPGCSGNRWQLQKINDGGATNGPPAASAPSVNVYSGHDQQHFAYLATNANGRNGEIWDAFYCSGCSGNKWHVQKINDGGMTSGPPAVSAPFVDTYAEHDQQHFAYRAANGEIWDAFYCPGCSGSHWQLQKINDGGATIGPPAASAPFVNVYSGHDQQHFAYLAINTFAITGEIWDAFYCSGCSGNKWHVQKINDGGMTSGPAAVSAPFVDTYTEHDQQHFAYLAANGEIWHALYCPGCSGSHWRLQQLTGQ